MTTLGVITGLRFEADILVRASSRKGVAAPKTASVAGRQQRAYEEALRLVTDGARALVSFGIAGGLNSETPVGALVLAEAVIGEKGEGFETTPGWRQALADLVAGEITPVGGPVISLSHALETEAVKAAAHKKTGAVAVDMESFGVAKAAQERKVPFLVIRAISDSVADQLPASVVPAMAEDGSIRIAPLISGTLKNPGDVVRLPAFGLKTARANRTLRRVALLGLPRFGL